MRRRSAPTDANPATPEANRKGKYVTAAFPTDLHSHGLALPSHGAAFPFAAIAMALNAALSTVLVSVPAVRKLLLAAAGAA